MSILPVESTRFLGLRPYDADFKNYFDRFYSVFPHLHFTDCWFKCEYLHQICVSSCILLNDIERWNIFSVHLMLRCGHVGGSYTSFDTMLRSLLPPLLLVQGGLSLAFLVDCVGRFSFVFFESAMCFWFLITRGSLLGSDASINVAQNITTST